MARHRGPTRLDDLYTSRPPWDIGHPQSALAALAEQDEITGRVLDIGCGTGEHTLMAAALGLKATGIDLSANALRLAAEKAQQRSLSARFVQHDALRLAELGEEFDTVLDALVLHAFDAAQRASYVDGVRSVLRSGGRLFVLCYTDSQPVNARRPVRIGRTNLHAMEQFVSDVSAEEMSEGGKFVRRLVRGPFSDTNKVDYCDPPGHHDGD